KGTLQTFRFVNPLYSACASVVVDQRSANCHRPCFHFIVASQDTSTTRTPRSAAKPNSEDSNAPPRTAPSSADGLTTPRRTPSLVRNPYALILGAEDP